MLTLSDNSTHNGYFIHPAGKLSTGAVLDVGLKCTHSCRFCYYSYLDGTDDQFLGMRQAKFRTLEECKQILTLLKQNGFTHFDYTGGEPSLHPNIIEITRYAHQELGLHGRMITLGQFLMRKMKGCQHDKLIDDLLEAGLTNFLFSMHAADEEIFQRTTNESFARQRQAMCYLDEKGFQYTANTTVFEWNYKHLPDLALEVTKHNIYLHNFIIMNAYYEWNKEGRAFGVQAKYSDIQPYLYEAVNILEANKIGVNIRYAPLCSVKGLEKNLVGMVGVRYDPYEWMNLAGHKGGSPQLCAAKIPLQQGQIEEHLRYHDLDGEFDNGVKVTGARGNNLKLFSDKCATCQAKNVCDGIDANYLRRYGSSEFVPYEEYETAPLQKARYSYLIPFIVKTEQYTDMKKIVAEKFAEFNLHSLSTHHSAVVSVIIPCYNYAHYLPDAVKSVLAQTYQDFEIIIVNDGSTDNTKEVAEQLIIENPTYKIRLINQENSGQPAISRNRGITQANGRYILCLDADDMIAPTMLEECLNLLEADKTKAIAYTDRLDFDGVDQIVPAGNYDFNGLRFANQISYCALFKREVWEKVGGYRTNVKGVEDWDFWIAAGARGFAGNRIPKPLFKYRRHDTGVYQEVINNQEKKFAQIILNNLDVYDPQQITNARQLLQIEDTQNSITQPLVSVIIPTFNRPDWLIKAIQSILNQTFQNFEIIVINDGGVGVETLINSLNHKHNIIYINLGYNQGTSAAKNAGIKVARGKYIALLDDDDLFYPEHLETALKYLNPNQPVVYTKAVRATYVKQGKSYTLINKRVPYAFEYDRHKLIVANISPNNCFVFSKELAFQAGLFDETLSTLEDWDFWIKLSALTPFKYIPLETVQVNWRSDGTTLTSSRDLEFDRNRKIIYERYQHQLKAIPNVQQILDEFNAIWSKDWTFTIPLTSIIILTHNGLEHTRLCLSSIEAHTPQPYELILVDNNSTDGTLDFLRNYQATHQHVRLITNSENRGFAAGNNQGLTIAQGDYILLLNNDTIVTEGWLARMLSVFERYPEVGLVGPMSNYVAGPQLVQEVSYQSVETMEQFASTWADTHIGQTSEFFRLVGFCLMIRRSVIDRIGGLDERFGRGNFEDDDFCLRAVLSGFKARIAQDVFIHHTGSQTFKDIGLDYGPSLEHNWDIFKAKWSLPAHLPYGTNYFPYLTGISANPLELFIPLLASQVQVTSTSPNDSSRVLSTGAAALQRGDFETAAREFEQVTRQHPDLAAAYTALGLVLVTLNRLGEAVPALRRAAELVPHLAAVHNQLGVALYRLGQLAEAEAAFETARQVAPNDLESRLNLIDLYREQQRYDAESALVKEALTLDPHHPDVLLSFGVLSLELGDIEGADLAWQRLKAAHPNHPGTAALADVLGYGNSAKATGLDLLPQIEIAQTEGHWSQAIELLEVVLQSGPSLNGEAAPLWNRLGYCRFMNNQLAEAESAFQRGLELAPDNLDLLGNLADLYLGQEHFDRATEYLNRALQIDPNDVNLLLTLGNCAIQLEAFDTALTAFQRVQNLAPDTEGVEDVLLQLEPLVAAEVGL